MKTLILVGFILFSSFAEALDEDTVTHAVGDRHVKHIVHGGPAGSGTTTTYAWSAVMRTDSILFESHTFDEAGKKQKTWLMAGDTLHLTRVILMGANPSIYGGELPLRKSSYQQVGRAHFFGTFEALDMKPTNDDRVYQHYHLTLQGELIIVAQADLVATEVAMP